MISEEKRTRLDALPNRILWESLEHEHEGNSDDWYWIVAIVGVGAAVLAIFFNNVLFALFILLAIFTSIMHAHSPKLLREYEINRKGVRIDNTLYPFSSLESFWVIDMEDDDEDKIFIKSNRTMMPLIVLPYSSAEIDPELLRDYLLEYLDEEELVEPVSQKIMEALGFR
jgi:hypothetical protein